MKRTTGLLVQFGGEEHSGWLLEISQDSIPAHSLPGAKTSGLKHGTQPMDDRCNTEVAFIDGRIRFLGWLTVALAMAPVSGVLLTFLIALLSAPFYPAQGGHGGPWADTGIGPAVIFVGFLAAMHVPYTILLCFTARGLFQLRQWARIMTLCLTPFLFVLMLFTGGGIVFAIHLAVVRHLTVELVLVGILGPLTLTGVVYCVLSHLWLWNPDVRTLFKSQDDANVSKRADD